MDVLEALTNDNFKVLDCMYENRDWDGIVKFTQGEIAEIVGVSRATINNIFKILKQTELIQDTNHVGRYQITELGIDSVEIIKKLVR